MSNTFTFSELRAHDGKGISGRVYVALNGKVYDVTDDKLKFGPNGPVTVYAGRDATRGLATMTMDSLRDSPDDLSDLTKEQWDLVNNWENKFQAKYKCVGSLVD